MAEPDNKKSISVKHEDQMQHKYLIGDSMQKGEELEDNSIQLNVSSPPYFNVRYYGNEYQIFDDKSECSHEWILDIPSIKKAEYIKKGDEGELLEKYTLFYFCKKCGAWNGVLGNEPNYMDRILEINDKHIKIRGYIPHLADRYDFLLRKLNLKGSNFIVIGDTFASKIKGTGGKKSDKNKIKDSENYQAFKPTLLQLNEQDGVELDIPSLFSIEMKNRGWLLKQKIIWYKRNPMPSPIVRKWTMNYEIIYWFVRDIKKYYFNTQYEALIQPNATSQNSTHKHSGYNNPFYNGFKYDAKDYEKRIQRATFFYDEDDYYLDIPDFWDIPTRGTKVKHFATFPPTLLFPIICATSQEGDLICDNFIGTGTTILSALALKRRAVGIEINPKNEELFNFRLQNELDKLTQMAEIYKKSSSLSDTPKLIPKKYKNLNSFFNEKPSKENKAHLIKTFENLITKLKEE